MSTSTDDRNFTVREVGEQKRVTLPDWVREAVVYDAYDDYEGEKKQTHWLEDMNSQHVVLSNIVPNADRFVLLSTSKISDRGSVRIPAAAQDTLIQIVDDATIESGVIVGFVAWKPMLVQDNRTVFCLHEHDLFRYMGSPAYLDVQDSFAYQVVSDVMQEAGDRARHKQTSDEKEEEVEDTMMDGGVDFDVWNEIAGGVAGVATAFLSPRQRLQLLAYVDAEELDRAREEFPVFDQATPDDVVLAVASHVRREVEKNLDLDRKKEFNTAEVVDAAAKGGRKEYVEDDRAEPSDWEEATQEKVEMYEALQDDMQSVIDEREEATKEEVEMHEALRNKMQYLIDERGVDESAFEEYRELDVGPPGADSNTLADEMEAVRVLFRVLDEVRTELEKIDIEDLDEELLEDSELFTGN